MFIRVVTGIQRHFDDRVVEWAMAATGMYWGWTLAQPGTAWTNPAAWAGMMRLLSEDSWGMVSMAAGGFWLVALAVNGTFADTVYSRASPYVRCLGALGACFVWGQVLLSVSAVQTSGSGIYPLPFALSIWCVRSTWGGLGDERRRSRANHRRS